MSGGAFFRSSIRRELELPPLWQRPRAAPTVFPLPDHRTMAQVDAASPGFEQIAGAGYPRPTVAAAATRGHRKEQAGPPRQGSALKPANARERHTDPAPEMPPAPVDVPLKVIAQLSRQCRAQIAKGVPLDLAAAPSALDQRSRSQFRKTYTRTAHRPEVAPVMLPCSCGSQSGSQPGMVPAWFGRDCIEARCPLRIAP